MMTGSPTWAACIVGYGKQMNPADTEDKDYQLRHQFAELFQEAPLFMALLRGPEHVFEFVNPGYRRLIGHRDVVGRRVVDVMVDAVAQGYLAVLDQVYRSGLPFSASSAKFAEQAEPGGPVSERYLDFVYQPLREPGGGVAGIFVLGTDVTDRVLNEIRRDALIRLTDSLRSLQSPEDMMYCAGRILGETLGLSRAGFGVIDLAQDSLFVSRDWHAEGVASLAGSTDLRQFGDFVDELKAGHAVVVDDVRVDPRTSAARASFAAFCAGAFVDMPIVEDGSLVALLYANAAAARAWSQEDLAFVREVAERTRTASERLRSDSALAASEAKFRTIANAMPQMVWATLADGYHDYYNDRWYDFTGVPRGATDGIEWAAMFHPDDRERAWDVWRHSLASGTTYEIQYRLRHRDGNYRWVLGRALPVRDEGGRIVRWMGTCTDIHDQKMAEEELRQSNQRKDEFLAMLAHELRNPLAPISTAAQVLRMRRHDPAYVERAGEIIERQARHMTTLVDDLLDVSRVTRGLVRMESGPVDLKAVVNSAIEQARPLIEARHHALLIRIGAAQAWARGDRTRLIQAVSNLLNNAAKYTPQHGELSVSLEVQGGQAQISVADNGSGISPALLPHVFELFTQGERTPDRSQGGLGLGLALVRSIVAQHGGQVAADSEGAGRGSMFTINLPTSAAPDAHAGAQDTDPGFAPAALLRIVVVDDNRDAGESLKAVLEAVGHEVALFADAESLLADGGPAADAYILDIGLPRIDGYQLARELRRRPGAASALLVALTGYGQAHDYTLSKAAGFDHHLVKPADLAQLERILAQTQSAAK
jgi:PAS domain S-box-containing protein